jgi:V8-like Glu-specific endopeptidase
MSSSLSSNPNNAVVRISSVFPTYTEFGSGFLIAPNLVLTAAHVVYSTSTGLGSEVEVTAGQGTASAVQTTGTVIGYNPIVVNNSMENEQSAQTDFALVRLDQPITNFPTMSLAAGFSGGTVTIAGYPASAAGEVSQTQTVTLDPNYAMLIGTPTGQGSSGGPLWVDNSSGTPEAVGMVTMGDTSTQYNVQFTASDLQEIAQWEQDAPPPEPQIAYTDTTTGQSGTASESAYTGPYTPLSYQYNANTNDNMCFASPGNGLFITTGSGSDAITVQAGDNVIDAGGGSNFITSGTGSDTIFVDVGSGINVWDTLVNFHSGDSVGIWGFVPGADTVTWAPAAMGAPGYTGLTLMITACGQHDEVTFAGLSAANIPSLAMSSGTTSDNSYLEFKHV